MLYFCFMQWRMNAQKEHAMTKKSLFSLLAILFLAVAGTGVGASTPVEPAVEPATPPAAVLELDLASDQICTESMDGETVLAAGEAAPTDVLSTDTGWWYGICYPNFCQQCYSDYDCTGSNTCQFGVQCP